MNHLNLTCGAVTIGGQEYILQPGKTPCGALAADFNLRQPEPGFYDWTITLTNTGDGNTGRVTDFQGLNLFFPLGADEPFVYNGLRGDDCSIDSFTPETVKIAVGDTLTRAPFGGRPSDTSAFPYFDFSCGGTSVVCGIGWSGQWKMTLTRDAGGVTVTAGQETLDTVLYPGESIRSARVLLWAGETDTLHARQRFVACHRRYASPFAELGIDFDCPICAQAFDRYFWNADTKDGKIPYFETEKAQLKLIDSAARCGYFNTFWLDACWFKDTFRCGVGNYTLYFEGFPRGLRPLADEAHATGQKFIVWFEPVRTDADTEAYNRFAHNPGQLVRLKDCKRILLNIGDDEVWDWVYNKIVTTMEKNGIDWYREDFNISPLGYLNTLDTDDRKGMAEMKFVTGLYRLWDTLRAHFPGLVIDNCASGGRLLDAPARAH